MYPLYFPSASLCRKDKGKEGGVEGGFVLSTPLETARSRLFGFVQNRCPEEKRQRQRVFLSLQELVSNSGP